MNFHSNQIFFNACKDGNIEQVKLHINDENINLDEGLYWSCYKGYGEIVELILTKENMDYNGALSEACSGGHIHIAKLLFSKCPNIYTYEYEITSNGINGRGLSDSLFFACNQNHKELILLLILYGADINDCRIDLEFEDIYYLLQSGLTEFGKFDDIALECKKWKLEFENTINKLFITDVANIMIEY